MSQRGCARGDHAACTRHARALVARDPAAAIAVLAPACAAPSAPTVKRCEALASMLLTVPAPHRDAARAEVLYRATCGLGSSAGCSLRRVLCGRERALPGCAATPPERAAGP